MFKRFVAAMLFGAGSTIGLHGQSPLLNPRQSSVYLEFKKMETCPSSEGEERVELARFALRNNTRWTISVRASGGKSKCHGGAALHYSVEANGPAGPEGPIPLGYWFDIVTGSEIGPGKSIEFSVPRSHVDPGLSIRVDFTFDWETNGRYTRHSTYFSYWDLPERFRDKAKEKKLKCLRGLCVVVSEPVLLEAPFVMPSPNALTLESPIQPSNPLPKK